MQFFYLILFVCYVVPLSNGDLSQTQRERVIRKHLPGKNYCGMQHWDDFPHTESEENSDEADVNEFPWLVTPRYTDFFTHCVGFIISRRYFISSPFCLQYSKDYTELKWLAGVHHIRKNKSCISTRFGDDCTEDAQVITVEKYHFITTPYFGIAKMEEKLFYSDFIRPICLPLEDSERYKVNDTVMVSGWVSSESTPNDRTIIMIKQRSKRLTEPVEDCNTQLDDKVCTIPYHNTTTCVSVDGGPVMHKFGNNWFATALMTGSVCGSNPFDVADGVIFTPERVDQIISFIYENEPNLHI